MKLHLLSVILFICFMSQVSAADTGEDLVTKPSLLEHKRPNEAASQSDSGHAAKGPISSDFYELLLSNQTTYFENLLVMIGVVVTALILLTTIFNVVIARSMFRNDAERIFRDQQAEREKLLKEEILSVSHISKCLMEHNSAKFYVTSIIPGKNFLATAHFFRALELWLELENDVQVRNTLSDIHSLIDTNNSGEYISNPDALRLRQNAIQDHFDYEKFKNMIASIDEDDNLMRDLKNNALKTLERVNQSV